MRKRNLKRQLAAMYENKAFIDGLDATIVSPFSGQRERWVVKWSHYIRMSVESLDTGIIYYIYMTGVVKKEKLIGINLDSLGFAWSKNSREIFVLGEERRKVLLALRRMLLERV